MTLKRKLSKGDEKEGLVMPSYLTYAVSDKRHGGQLGMDFCGSRVWRN